MIVLSVEKLTVTHIKKSSTPQLLILIPYLAFKYVPTHELTQQRTGGLGNILVTLFHIIEIEHNWISNLKGVPILDLKFSTYENNLNGLIELSQKLQSDIQEYLEQWDDRLAFQELKITEDWGQIHCTYGEVLRHIIAHEVHHIGQLSIWKRVLGIEPPTANFIHRGIMLNPDPKQQSHIKPHL